MLALASLLAGGVFYLVEERTEFPVIRLATLRNRGVSSGLAMSALVSTVRLGAVGYWLLTGTHVFRGNTVMEVLAHRTNQRAAEWWTLHRHQLRSANAGPKDAVDAGAAHLIVTRAPD